MSSLEALRMVQEHLYKVTQEPGGGGGADGAPPIDDATLRRVLGKSLATLLHKLEYQVAMVRIAFSSYTRL
jgi:hypothetical protein